MGLLAMLLIPALVQPALGMPGKQQGSFLARTIKSFKGMLKPPPPKIYTPAETLTIKLNQVNYPLWQLGHANNLNSFPHKYIHDNVQEYHALNSACRVVIQAYNHAVQHNLPLGEVQGQGRKVIQAGANLMSIKLRINDYTLPGWINTAQKSVAHYKEVQKMLSLPRN